MSGLTLCVIYYYPPLALGPRERHPNSPFSRTHLDIIDSANHMNESSPYSVDVAENRSTRIMLTFLVTRLVKYTKRVVSRQTFEFAPLSYRFFSINTAYMTVLVNRWRACMIFMDAIEMQHIETPRDLCVPHGQVCVSVVRKWGL